MRGLIKMFTAIAVIYPLIANAGVLYLELPEDITIEIAQNPTPEQDEMIDSFILNELNRIDSEGADRIVIVTKNGVVL